MASTRVLAFAFVCLATAVQAAQAHNWPQIVFVTNAGNTTRNATGTGGAGNGPSGSQQKRQESLRETLRAQDADTNPQRPRTRTAQERAELREQLRRQKADAAQ
jgi:hypothetical protein